MKTKRETHGFTLVEIIVVLVILAILAAIIIPAMVGWIDKAQQKRLIVECRTCVLAAQSVASEEYGTLGASGIAVTPEKVLALADVPGTVSGIEWDAATAAINVLSYTRDGDTVTYYRTPEPHYEFGDRYSQWQTETAYAVGDKITYGTLIFECSRAHTSGSATGTTNPGESLNKSTWCVVGTTDGITPRYSSQYRYAAGVTVAYGDKTYMRTDYNPNGGSTPTANSLYWDVVE